MTTRAGVRSQGASARVWMFCASCSRTPQLMAGGRMPRPRKESEVSLMIITGMASELGAMMWLRKVGTMWRRLIRMRQQPARRAATPKSSPRKARETARASRRRVGRDDQMQLGLEQAKDAIRKAGRKEPYGSLLLRVGHPFHAERRRVALADDGGHPRREPAIVEQMHHLHRNEGLSRVGPLGVLG